ncbi:MAG: hypothetical protein KF689_11470 [Gemmatimonadaceae bacterium]|nr:hypothetical protein [Gemmatimonadaceae bacterium]MCW5825784.1 hypothetical protein [Gemmatimonadaceae bacterium]
MLSDLPLSQRWGRHVVRTLAALLAAMQATLLVVAGLAGAAVTAPAQARGDSALALYRYPNECVQAARRREAIAERTTLVDSLDLRTRNVVSTTLRSVAAMCGGAHTLAVADTDALPDLALLAAFAGTAARSDSALQIYLERTAAAPEALERAIATLLAMRPTPRRQDAWRLMARLDSLGDAAIPARLRAYLALAQDALTDFDEGRLTRATRAGLALTTQLGEADDHNLAAEQALLYRLASRAALFGAGGVTEALGVLERGAARVGKYSSEAHETIERGLAGMRVVGQTSTPLQGGRWFPAGTDSTRPLRGRPTLLLFVEHTCLFSCYDGYYTFRRLAATYAARGIDLVIVTRSQRYFRRRPAPMDYATEAPLLAMQYLEELALPAAMVVTETVFKPMPDGRQFPELNPNEQAYGVLSSLDPTAVLIDGDGLIRLSDSLNHTTEALWRAMLDLVN